VETSIYLPERALPAKILMHEQLRPRVAASVNHRIGIFERLGKNGF